VQSTDELPRHEPWVAGLLAEVTQGDADAYVGFIADEGEGRIRAAYPEATWNRLRQVKAQYDPDNVFRLNQNIPPA
jgi:FAD/FMN-containing dehydrogenase